MAGWGRVSPSQEGSGWQPVGSGLECGSPTSASSCCRPGLILPATRGQHGGTGEGPPGSRRGESDVSLSLGHYLAGPVLACVACWAPTNKDRR